MTDNKEIETINDIKNNYYNMEESIVRQLNFSVKHGPSIGGFREEIWKSLFEQIVPKKFSIERSVFIIDSYGHVSNEVDLAIFDEQYTPYIFRYGTLKFIPIEAVAVVIECKSSCINKKNLLNWSNSINNLKTSFNSVARMATNIVMNNEDKINDENKTLNNITQTSTRPIKILCYVKDGENIADELKENFDFIIQAKKHKDKDQVKDKKKNDNKDKLIITCKDQDKRLSDWHKSLNHYNSKVNIENKWLEEKQNVLLSEYTVNDNSILTLIFQLNQLLMLINNPILFPHMSYVKLFNDL